MEIFKKSEREGNVFRMTILFDLSDHEFDIIRLLMQDSYKLTKINCVRTIEITKIKILVFAYKFSKSFNNYNTLYI